MSNYEYDKDQNLENESMTEQIQAYINEDNELVYPEDIDLER